MSQTWKLALTHTHCRAWQVRALWEETGVARGAPLSKVERALKHSYTVRIRARRCQAFDITCDV